MAQTGLLLKHKPHTHMCTWTSTLSVSLELYRDLFLRKVEPGGISPPSVLIPPLVHLSASELSGAGGSRLRVGGAGRVGRARGASAGTLFQQEGTGRLHCRKALLKTHCWEFGWASSLAKNPHTHRGVGGSKRWISGFHPVCSQKHLFAPHAIFRRCLSMNAGKLAYAACIFQRRLKHESARVNNAWAAVEMLVFCARRGEKTCAVFTPCSP